jgi:2-polyprenyl-6-hydroxyphenyl methylase/3-demethylubiquinone-9 3-methyltransferase
MAANGIAVVANDLCSERLKAGISNFVNGDRIMLRPGNLFELDPRATGQFDLIVATEIIEHVAHTDEFLRHLARFLAPDGHIFLTSPNGSYFRNRLATHSMITDFKALESKQFKPDADGHLFLLTPHELIGIARSCGLSLVEIDFTGTPFITGHCRLSMISCRQMTRLYYWLEAQSHRLPGRLREKICSSMSIILCKSEETGRRRLLQAPLEGMMWFPGHLRSARH